MVVVCVHCRAVQNAFLSVRMCCPLTLRGKKHFKGAFQGDFGGVLGGWGRAMCLLRG